MWATSAPWLSPPSRGAGLLQRRGGACRQSCAGAGPWRRAPARGAPGAGAEGCSQASPSGWPLFCSLELNLSGSECA